MPLITNVLLTNVFLMGLSFLALRYGNEGGNRWVDVLNRLIRIRIPAGMRQLVTRLFGTRTLKAIDSAFSYVAYERNPLTMILYLVLCIGGYIAFILSAYPHLPNEILIFPYHKEAGFCVFCLSLYFFLNSASVDPGIITKANHAAIMKMYPFDGVIFKKANICQSCRIEKPARSKHCRMTGLEIARFDHYCIWIHQPVGAGNIKPFLLFLFFNNIMCLYGAYLGIGVLVNMVQTEKLAEAWFRDSYSGNRYKASPYYIFVYLMGRETLLVYMTILLSILGVFLVFFSSFHWVTLMRKGITTNEHEKLKAVTPEEAQRFLAKYSKGSWRENLKQLWRQKWPSAILTLEKLSKKLG